MQLTTNTRAFIEAEQYSGFILKSLQDGMLSQSFYRSISDFSHGDTLHIKTVGTVTLQDAAEDTELVYNPIESGEITFRLTEYVGDAWYVTDDLREDGNQTEALMAERSIQSTRAFQEKFETDVLSTAAQAYPLSDPYDVNGFAHKIVSAETNGTLQLDDIIKLRLAFDKAKAPVMGRILLVDPVANATVSQFITLTSNITPFAVDIMTNSASSDMQFRFNLYGFDIIQSNRLYGTTDASDGTNSITGAVTYNLAMCLTDDQTKPLMAAIRRAPTAEGERNKDKGRDEFVVRSRYGIGVQRMDTMATYVTHATNWKPA